MMLLLAFPIHSQGATLSTLMGTVYVDINLNGVFEEGDWGVRNDLIQLFYQPDADTAPVFLQQVLTDSEGRYSFTDLPNGLYTVKNTIFSSLGNTANVGQILDANGNVNPDNMSIPNSVLVQISDINLLDGSTGQGFNFGNDQYPMQLYSKYMLVADPLHQIQKAVVTTVPEPSLVVLLLTFAGAAGSWAFCRRRETNS